MIGCLLSQVRTVYNWCWYSKLPCLSIFVIAIRRGGRRTAKKLQVVFLTTLPFGWFAVSAEFAVSRPMCQISSRIYRAWNHVYITCDRDDIFSLLNTIHYFCRYTSNAICECAGNINQTIIGQRQILICSCSFFSLFLLPPIFDPCPLQFTLPVWATISWMTTAETLKQQDHHVVICVTEQTTVGWTWIGRVHYGTGKGITCAWQKILQFLKMRLFKTIWSAASNWAHPHQRRDKSITNTTQNWMLEMFYTFRSWIFLSNKNCNFSIHHHLYWRRLPCQTCKYSPCNRFEGAAGTQMPESAPGAHQCGTYGAGWLSGKGRVPKKKLVQWDH